MKFNPGDKVRHGTGTDGPVLEILGEDCSAPREAFHVRYPDGTCACYHESSLFLAQGAPSPATPKQPTTVQEIIVQYLEANGFDGLFNSDGACGCELADLCPCGGEFIFACEPGYKRKPREDEDPDYDFIISPDKPGTEPPAGQEVKL
jgi:hypothetical protein